MHVIPSITSAVILRPLFVGQMHDSLWFLLLNTQTLRSIEFDIISFSISKGTVNKEKNKRT